VGWAWLATHSLMALIILATQRKLLSSQKHPTWHPTAQGSSILLAPQHARRSRIARLIISLRRSV